MVSLDPASLPDVASRGDAAQSHLSPSHWSVALWVFPLLLQAAWLHLRRRGPPAVYLQFGSTADGLVPNKPPKSADVPKAADIDGSALVLPFSPAAKERRERKRNKGRD
ncbi:unnamed protein product [Eretmochelys imbricata]